MSEQETPHPCGDWPAPCNCDDPETHDGAEQETARTVEEAALEARRAAREIVPGASEQEKLWRDGFVRGAAWRAARMPSEEQVAEVLCEPRHREPDRWPLQGEARFCGRCIEKAEQVRHVLTSYGVDPFDGSYGVPQYGALVDDLVALWGAL